MKPSERQKLKVGSQIHRVERTWDPTSGKYSDYQIVTETISKILFERGRYLLRGHRRPDHMWTIERGYHVSKKKAVRAFEKDQRQYLQWAKEDVDEARARLRLAKRLAR